MSDKKKQTSSKQQALKTLEENKKSHTFSNQLKSGRTTKTFDNAKSVKTQYPVWKFSSIDWYGEWGWKQLSNEQWQSIIQKLQNFESMTWGEIEGANSHLIQISDCPNPRVQKRLNELQLDDYNELFSLRLSAKERVFGVLFGNVLKLLWYDPEHQVWPAYKKHT